MAPKTQLFRGQDYKKLRKQCEKEGKKFVDPEFTPDTRSLFYDETRKHDIAWKRPSDMSENPRLFVDGASVHDVTQGVLGNCWFVAACSALTHNSKLMDKVIPDVKLQNMTGSFQLGIFHFCFWRFGTWVDVVIDDFLPTENDKLIFAHSKDTSEYWSALLEKAFAKLYGNYEALIGGQLPDALVEVSAGVPEHIDLTKVPNDEHSRSLLFYSLMSTWEKKALIIAAIKTDSPTEVEEPLECGLVKGHAYAVSMVKQVELDNKKNTSLLEVFAGNERIRMVRLHNPWGEKEWNGPWSDGSKEWEQVTNAQKKELGIVVDEDGQFWMPWSDMCRYFTSIIVCHMRHTNFFSGGSRFHETTMYGEWVTPNSKPGKITDRAGGCANFANTFLLNPQYQFDIKEDGLEQVMFALTQKDFDDDVKNKKTDKRRQPPHLLTIGMQVMKVEENRRFRLHQLQPTTATSDYIRTRTVLLKLTNVKRGRYVLLCTTYAPGEFGKFMLRIDAPTNDLHVRELKFDEPLTGCLCCIKSPLCVTRLTIKKAAGVETKGGNRRVDPYLYVTCEGKKLKSHHIVDTTMPEFNIEYIFHRFKPLKPIIVEVWDANYVRDAFLGRATIATAIDNEAKDMEIQLMSKDDTDPRPRSGKLFVNVATYDDAKYL